MGVDELASAPSPGAEPAPGAAPPAGGEALASPAQPTLAAGLELSAPKGPAESLPLGTPGDAAQKTIYSLNPFDRGASRDLSKPVSVDAPAPESAEDDGAGQGDRGDDS